MDKFGYTQTQVTEKFKKTQAWVSYRLRLAERLSPQTKEAFITRVIKTSHARELAELPVDDQPQTHQRAYTLPKDIQEFEKEHGPEQPKFEVGKCPRCRAVLQREKREKNPKYCSSCAKDITQLNKLKWYHKINSDISFLEWIFTGLQFKGELLNPLFRQLF